MDGNREGERPTRQLAFEVHHFSGTILLCEYPRHVRVRPKLGRVTAQKVSGWRKEREELKSPKGNTETMPHWHPTQR
ncbi:hypothetical protein chiPu_0029332, partial [Chiloscyllium punctatum]|nr:hypothetical protein [Chiloscyllium punctatum]